MIVEDFALVLRRRRPWEALDLGIVIARRWRGPVLRAWLASYGVCGLVLSTLVLWDWRAAWFAIWWTKPLFDRVLLYVYSQAVFGTVPTLGETLAAMRGFLASGQLWADLTYRRFSPTRSFVLPITLLEGQTGRARAGRVAVLGRSMESCATWLTVACSNFVLLLSITLVAGVGVLTPIGVGWTGWFQGRLASQPVGIAEALCAIVLMMACETLVEPLYVASGFSLYLNRRSELEGWDLELVFRRMQRRLVAALRPGLGGLGGFSLILLVVAGCWSPQSVHAAPAPITPAAHGAALPPTVIPVAGGPIAGLAEAREQAHKVLLDPVFGQNVIQWHWQPRTASTPEAQPNLPAWLVGLARMAGRLVEALAFFLGWGVRVVLALLLGVVLLLAIVWAVRWNRGRSGHRSRPDLPISLFGLDVREEGLPTDVARAARVLIDAGEFSAALSLLYRACLVALIHRAHIRFRSGDTEDRCLERVVGHVDPASFEYFSRLVEAWRMTAYAHRPPEREGLTVLAASWTSHFGPDAALEGDRA